MYYRFCHMYLEMHCSSSLMYSIYTSREDGTSLFPAPVPICAPATWRFSIHSIFCSGPRCHTTHRTYHQFINIITSVGVPVSTTPPSAFLSPQHLVNRPFLVSFRNVASLSLPSLEADVVRGTNPVGSAFDHGQHNLSGWH
jgi:hypothetical protein